MGGLVQPVTHWAQRNGRLAGRGTTRKSHPARGEASRAIATRGDGGSFTSALPAPQRWIISAVVHIIGTKSPAAAIKKGLGTGLGTDRSHEILMRFTPEAKPSTSTARA